MKKNCIKNGFTLVELLISITIFVMFFGVVSSVYMNIVKSQIRFNEIRRMYSGVRDFMDFLSENLRLYTVDYDCYNQFNLDFSNMNSVVDKLKYNEKFVNGGVNFCGGSRGFINDGFTDKLFLIGRDKRSKMIIYLDKKVDVEGYDVLVRKFVLENGVWKEAKGYFEPRYVLSSNLLVKSLRFAVFPDVNPYSSDVSVYSNNATQFQPKVSVFLSVESLNPSVIPFHYDFQTSISSRVYSK